MSEQPSLPLISHLVELRSRLLKAVIAVLIVFVALVGFANDIYHLLAEPLLKHMPDGASMIATDVASPFFTPIKLTLVLSFAIAIPAVFYQVWAFVAPGLYKHERKLVFPMLFVSSLLFYLGMAFCYFVVFPLVFAFFTSAAPEGVAIATDIASYLDFVLKLFFAFGLAFEVPIATVLLCWSGATTPASLRKKRPYVIVGAFIFGMLLTPPDAFSQTLLALPMWILYELGILVASLRKYGEEDEQEPSETS
jgi:sec-independent protein translocase protein TatC